MFTLQVGFMSPSFVGIVPSIEMVIFAAVGGMSLLGAVYGTLLVNFGKTYFSETFPDLWLFLMAACSSRGDGLPQWPGRLWQSQGKRLMASCAGLQTGSPVAAEAPSRSPDHPPLNPSVMASSQARPWRPANERTRHRFRIGCPSGLAIEDLTVSFDGFKAIDNLNLYVQRNELRVIIGPNGAGKTTCWT
jgi:urea transport system permease protein